MLCSQAKQILAKFFFSVISRLKCVDEEKKTKSSEKNKNFH
jgi:hypothetical protein